jgi:hypothetical protein
MVYQRNLKHLGNIAVIRAMKHFAENGYSILLPMADYQKYDLVVERDDKSFRIQCKATTKSTVHLTPSGHCGGKYLDLPIDCSKN